jgi:alpha-beta hydrolase superfamily lysophospholipase
MPKVSVFGSSLGAILASMAAAVDGKIDRAFLVGAGGSLVDLLTESDQELLVKMRQDRMAAYGLASAEEYREFLSTRLHFEPTRWVPAPNSGKAITLLIATEDTTVPTETQEALWEAWGRPRRIDVSQGHVLSIIWTWAFYRATVVDRLLGK